MIPHFCGRESTECVPVRPQILWWWCSWRHQDLAVGVGVAEGLEGVGDAFEGDLAGDHRRDVDVALCDRSQRLVELHRVVAEAELDVQLLADPEERVYRFVAPAHAQIGITLFMERVVS